MSVITPDQFGRGWAPEFEAAARADWEPRGMPRLYYGSTLAADTRPLPEAFSLQNLIYWYFNQGPVGSCFANAGCSAMQITTAAAVDAGESFEQDQLSRAFIWYGCRKYDRSIGTPNDGGTIINTLRAMHEMGVPRESAWPYKPDHRWLEKRPPEDVLQAAMINKLTNVVDIDPKDIEARKRAIFNGCPYVVGIWWPFGWDYNEGNMVDQSGRPIPCQIDQFGRTKGIGAGTQGHALVDVGWINDWDGNSYWIRFNSHDDIYPIPPSMIRARIPGYKTSPGRKDQQDYCFFVRFDHDRAVNAKPGGCEYMAPGGIAGIKIRNLVSWKNAMG